MRTTKREMREVEVDGPTTCDRCGDVIPDRSGGEIDEVTIERKTGSSFHGDSWGDVHEADVCGKCWETVVVPTLEFAGVRFRKRTWDY